MTDRDKSHLGALRRSTWYTGDGPNSRRGEEIWYSRCDTCGLVAQSITECRTGHLGFGSWTRPSVQSQIQSVKTHAQAIAESESMRRVFRAPEGRCTCDPIHDALVLSDPEFARERMQRDEDVNRPDVAPAGWHVDPHRQAQYRFWNGRVWTELVSNNGVESLDIPRTQSLQRKATQASTPSQKTGKAKRSPRTGRSDLTGQLRELNDLYEAGVLTSEQFEAAKNKLLGLD